MLQIRRYLKWGFFLGLVYFIARSVIKTNKTAKGAKTVHLEGIKIKQASERDILQGWIRVPEHLRRGIPNASFAKIKVDKKTVYCQIRGTPSSERAAIVNEHYRDLLGVKDGQEVDLDITRLKWIFGKIRALPMHPDHLVRFGFGFSFIGLFMGMIALIVALLPYTIKSFATSWSWAGYVTLITLLIVAFFIGYLISAAVEMFRNR